VAVFDPNQPIIPIKTAQQPAPQGGAVFDPSQPITPIAAPPAPEAPGLLERASQLGTDTSRILAGGVIDGAQNLYDRLVVDPLEVATYPIANAFGPEAEATHRRIAEQQRGGLRRGLEGLPIAKRNLIDRPEGLIQDMAREVVPIAIGSIAGPAGIEAQLATRTPQGAAVGTNLAETIIRNPTTQAEIGGIIGDMMASEAGEQNLSNLAEAGLQKIGVDTQLPTAVRPGDSGMLSAAKTALGEGPVVSTIVNRVLEGIGALAHRAPKHVQKPVPDQAAAQAVDQGADQVTHETVSDMVRGLVHDGDEAVLSVLKANNINPEDAVTDADLLAKIVDRVSARVAEDAERAAFPDVAPPTNKENRRRQEEEFGVEQGQIDPAAQARVNREPKALPDVIEAGQKRGDQTLISDRGLTPGDQAGFDKNAGALNRDAKMALLDRYGHVPESVDQQRRLYQKMQDEEIRQGDNLEAMSVLNTGGDGPTNAASRPQASATRGSPDDVVATGIGDRPFKADFEDGRSSVDRTILTNRAYTKATKDFDAAMADLERRWAERERARKAGEQSQRERAESARAEDRYKDAKGSFNNKPKGFDEGGDYEVDEFGFVRSERGGPIIFGDQKQAGKWILREANKNAKRQVFDIHNHPSGKGFTVKVRHMREAASDAADDAATAAKTEPASGEPLQLEGPARAEPEVKAQPEKVVEEPAAPKAEAEPDLRDPVTREAYPSLDDALAGRKFANKKVEAATVKARAAAPQELQGRVLRQINRMEDRVANMGFSGAADVRKALRDLDYEYGTKKLDDEYYRRRQPLETASAAAYRANAFRATYDDLVVHMDKKARGLKSFDKAAYDKMKNQLDDMMDDDLKKGFKETATEAQADVRAAAKQKAPKPDNIIDFAIDRGGITDPDGRFSAKGLDSIHQGNRGRLVSKSGMDPDKLREAAVEAGYLREDADIDDLYDAILATDAGNPVYADRDQGMAEAFSARRGAEEEAAQLDTLIEELRETARRDGMELYDSVLDDAARKMMLDDDLSPGRAIDKAMWDHAQRKMEEKQSYKKEEVDDEEIPFPEVGAARKSRDAGEGPKGSDQAGEQGEAASGQRGKNADQGDGPAVEKTEIGDQTVLKGAEKISDKELAERKMQGKKGTDKAQKDADEGLFDTGARDQTDLMDGLAHVSKNRFSANPMFDPAIWKAVLGPLWGASSKGLDKWLNHVSFVMDTVRGMNAKKSGESALKGFGRSLFLTVDGNFRSLAHTYNSKTINEIADMFHATAGHGDSAGRTYDEATRKRIVSKANKVEKILQMLPKRDKATLKRLVQLVQSPRSIQPGTPIGKAALELQALLKTELKYLREAGVDIGEVRDGYFPREIDVLKVSIDPKGFRDAAVRAYRRIGMDLKEAREAADAWSHNLLLDGNPNSNLDFAEVGGAPGGDFTKGRVLDKSADKILGEFLITDPSDVLATYFHRSTRKAEWTRRMGAKLEHWDTLKDSMRAEGVDEVGIEAVIKNIQSAAGIKPSGMSQKLRNSLGWARTMNTLGLLERATLTSISEMAMPAIRSGNIMNLMKAVHFTARDLLGGKSGMDMREIAEDLGLIVSSHNESMMAARYAGLEPETKAQSVVMDQYFRRTGLEQYTAATRVASTGIGQTFIRRLALDVAGNGSRAKSSRLFLKELGIPDNKIDQFAGWVKNQSGGMPTLDVLRSGDEMAEAYRTGLTRFVDQTIMDPSATTRPGWASHPVGSLVFQIQAFIWAFQKNVVNRGARLGAEAITGKGYGVADRATMLAPAAMLPTLAMIQYAIGDARDELFANPEWLDKQTRWDRTKTAISRSGLLGVLDPLINMATGVRYNRSTAETVAGPLIGRVTNAVDDFIKLGVRNSENTDTAEKNVSEAIYDLVVEPSANLALTLVPGKGLSGVVGAGATQLIGTHAAKDKLTDPMSGFMMDLLDGKPAKKKSSRGRSRSRKRSRSSR